MEIAFLLVAVFDILGGAEGVARLVAALLLFLHPVHEQRLGFREEFNLRIHGQGPRGVRSALYKKRPLGKKMNTLQAVALATVFPALVLFGPWWALAGIAAFYAGDYSWTHYIKRIPGFSSAVVAFLATCGALWMSRPEQPPSPLVVAGAITAGLLVLALPWIMAYRSVSRG